MDPETLSRIQFALTISFHFIYPPISMGLGILMVAMGFLHLRTNDPIWRQASFFWVKIYGLVFAMGIATGIVQEFEFGMNWAAYSQVRRQYLRQLARRRGHLCLLPGGRFPRLDAVRRHPARAAHVAAGDVAGRVRGALQRAVDHHGQLVDANAARLHLANDAMGPTSLYDRVLVGCVYALVYSAPAAHLGRFVDGRRVAGDERERVVSAQAPARRVRQEEPVAGAVVVHHPEQCCR